MLEGHSLSHSQSFLFKISLVFQGEIIACNNWHREQFRFAGEEMEKVDRKDIAQAQVEAVL